MTYLLTSSQYTCVSYSYYYIVTSPLLCILHLRMVEYDYGKGGEPAKTSEAGDYQRLKSVPLFLLLLLLLLLLGTMYAPDLSVNSAVSRFCNRCGT
ncbi:hypothetical protein GGS23DRAFT_219403 [Durotheca rogersii]|uniref:uncharacterized protein n=1 Tax=Durotheca rogersii TaxID=419775 RepID=UPI0022203FC4|nr:uncharacterized protein GGS23DRAFT_219403 [Durotheca rogersii]KAI5860667.1 hypothetical protein GGS23DRAFT_219403 [Durotheca rogersii]